MLMYGILALTSRVDALATGTGSDLESTYYHSRCMQLLIESLSKPPETYDSALLAAVVISRLYEENDTHTDTLTYHLGGMRTLLSNDTITRLAMEGGLAEASCWVHLRQAIYIAIVHRQHLNIHLGVYEALTASRRSDSTAHANRAIYIFALILLQYFPQDAPEIQPRYEDEWNALEKELNIWFETRPLSFYPLYEELQSDAQTPLPRIWMTSTVSTVALQYYYASWTMVHLKGCSTSREDDGFEAAKLRTIKEVRIAAKTFDRKLTLL